MNFNEKFLPLFETKSTKTIRAIGIDLGTTNCTVAEVTWNAVDAPTCRTLEIEQQTREGIYSSPLVPSVVAILPDFKVWVGEGAKRLRAIQEELGLVFEKSLFYETKNEMGLRKTYFRAPKDFNHASKIASHILSFLAKSATSESPLYDSISVTVPASFQLNQRRDTLLAAQSAGLKLADDDLFDEPTAALTDYFLTKSDEGLISSDRPTVCVVFDFGGGTCDVSVVEIGRDPNSSAFTMSELSVSRYHRLGGGDIDAAIVHEFLIPKILAENGLKTYDLTWAQKKKGLEPQLLSKAEALKIAICKEIDRLKKFGRYTDSDKEHVVAHQPTISCSLGQKKLNLSQPALSAVELEKLLSPFLDIDFLFARETEFRLTQSIFAPLHDALDRAEKTPDEIDFCLLVGGSCLIPQVRDAVTKYFKNSKIGTYEDYLDIQLAVARGAAWNGAIKNVLGRPFVQPLLHDSIALVASDGKLIPLIPAKEPLPFPSDGSFLTEKFMVPKNIPEAKELRFEVVSEADRQVIFNEIWTLPAGAYPGEKITMEYRITRGKQFECRAYLSKNPSSVLAGSIENPLVNVYNPNVLQVKIEDAEEMLRKKNGGTAADRDTFIQLAQWSAELNQREKALDYLRTALNKVHRPDPAILNLQGIYYVELRDYERGEKAYIEAAKAEPDYDYPLFNLALCYRTRGLYQEALDVIDKRIGEMRASGPTMVLKALCLESLKKTEESKEILNSAISLFNPPAILSDWELGWLYTEAKLAEDDKLLNKIYKEMKKRHMNKSDMRDDIPRPAIPDDPK